MLVCLKKTKIHGNRIYRYFSINPNIFYKNNKDSEFSFAGKTGNDLFRELVYFYIPLLSIPYYAEYGGGQNLPPYLFLQF